MVKWHLAMLFVNLNLSEAEIGEVVSTLYKLLEDKSVFVKARTISSLTILALDNPDKEDEITSKLKAKDRLAGALRQFGHGVVRAVGGHNFEGVPDRGTVKQKIKGNIK